MWKARTFQRLTSGKHTKTAVNEKAKKRTDSGGTSSEVLQQEQKSQSKADERVYVASKIKQESNSTFIAERPEWEFIAPFPSRFNRFTSTAFHF